MKIIIAGGRDFKDYKLLSIYCDYYLKNHSDIEIVSGTANGADQLGERYASERGYRLTKFPADWEKFGKVAGILRNNEMADYSEALIAFWNKKSPGTKHMIAVAEEKGLKVRTVIY